MEFRLAEILGMPVSIMKLTLTQNEYHKWLRYLQYKQPEVQEIQMAVLTTVASNAMGGKSKVDDFLLSKPPKPAKKHVGMSSNDVRAALMGLAIKKGK